MVDFRRGPLGPFFDGLAARLKERGYSHARATAILSKGCLFNSFLIDQGITRYKMITPAHVETFLDASLANIRTTSQYYSPRISVRSVVKPLFSYLTEVGALRAIKPKPTPTPYRWMLDPYMRYLREECEITEATIQQTRIRLCQFLEGLGEGVTRKNMKLLRAEVIDTYVKQHLKESPENLRRLASTLRRFLQFCARQRYVTKDFSGVIPSIPSYRLATLPKGMEESSLRRILDVIPKDTAVGARDYAIMLLMMAYGIRGKSVAELLLEDIDWPRSTIRIRARKGGKEVVLPLLEAVGEAIIRYLHHRPESPLREVFLSVRAPHFPLDTCGVSTIVHRHMAKAGVKMPGGGSNTLRHSWAIRALAQDSPMKAIADVLGHRCLNTTFIYAKADLEALRQVVMSWPKGR
jgi:integrase/recombinase XerD